MHGFRAEGVQRLHDELPHLLRSEEIVASFRATKTWQIDGEHLNAHLGDGVVPLVLLSIGVGQVQVWAGIFRIALRRRQEAFNGFLRAPLVQVDSAAVVQGREALGIALQGVDKMRANLALGLAQGIFLPQPRPDRAWLTELGANIEDADGGLWHRTLDELDACAAAYAAYGLAAGLGTWVGDPEEGVIVLPTAGLLDRYEKLPPPARAELA